ncbi:MAG: hypothetical protein ACNA8L_00165 [Luteolibacter sp.]|jgi:hypothetical protein
MSLRTFHIVFVTICTLLCVFMVLWALLFAESRIAALILGTVGALGAIGMPVYGVFFYRKASKILL